MHEVLDGADHSAFFEKWLTTAKTKLIHKETGLLISAFTYNGVPTEGPEGSSIWMIAHCLQLIDPDFAADQYRRAKEQLAGDFLGFSYAREWPASWQAMEDIDSGPIVPGLEASTGSSGLALLGDSSFNDDPWLSSLIGSLNFMGFPMRDGENLRYAASNQVGDAVLLYALVHGPLWQRINAGARP